MAKNTIWQDDYWLPLMQLYLRQPVGVKPTYSRDMVNLSLELHIAPSTLAEHMKRLAILNTPRIERIWKTYSDNPRRLTRAVRLWREMRGFGAEASFYEGVGVSESFERDFRPLPQEPKLTPVILILVLNLYFQLTPLTMVPETPEVIELARLVKVDVNLVVRVLQLYQYCDPYLNRKTSSSDALLPDCQDVWHRFGNSDTEQLTAFAEELKAYF